MDSSYISGRIGVLHEKPTHSLKEKRLHPFRYKRLPSPDLIIWVYIISPFPQLLF